jgi:methylmalonyl-CoA/ethylmalonyl-CoA epimerase
VDDIQAAHRALVERGVTFHEPPHVAARLPDHELWLAFFRDTEKNVLALMSEVRS